MRSKFFHAVAIAGIFALAGCSDDSGSNLTALTNGPDNKEAASDPEEDETTTKDKSNHEDETDISNPEDSTEPGESSPSGVLSSSNSGLLQSSSSESAHEQTFAFGYAMGNAPTPSKGCGKNSTLAEKSSNPNAKNYEIWIGSQRRTFWMTLPQNYSNNKPYKILFAMHCMGSNGEEFSYFPVPNQDHPSPYYGQQELDTENNYIFVSPDSRPISGNGEFGPWHQLDDEDHVFFSEMLTLLEENYCIDTSRVFVTGFSFGAMYTNSLSWEFQDRIRAVAVYATAAYNIYLPKGEKKKNLPIAWMDVHGQDDGTCPYRTTKENPPRPGAIDSALVEILRHNGPADASGNFTDVSDEKPEEYQGWGGGHVCYDFKKVDPRFPVKFCSWKGGHQWTAYDNGDWHNTWVPKTVHEFFEQF